MVPKYLAFVYGGLYRGGVIMSAPGVGCFVLSVLSAQPFFFLDVNIVVVKLRLLDELLDLPVMLSVAKYNKYPSCISTKTQ